MLQWYKKKSVKSSRHAIKSSLKQKKKIKPTDKENSANTKKQQESINAENIRS